MMDTPIDSGDPRMCRAIEEIEKLITSRYLSTTLAVTQSADPHGIRILATVDVDDFDEGLDLSEYFHRLAQLHVEEGLPLSAIPVQTPARLARLLAEHPAWS